MTTHSLGCRPSSPPCAADPDGWDLDYGSLPDWLRAIRACTECPFQRRCLADLFAAYPPDTEGPHGLIQAGIAFTSTGRRIPDAPALVEYASAGNQRRRAQQATAA